MESGKDIPDDNGGGGRSSSEREFECKGCGAMNVVKKSEGTPTMSSSSRKRKWAEAAATALEAGGSGSRRGNRLFNNAASKARKLNGEQGRTGRMEDSDC